MKVRRPKSSLEKETVVSTLRAADRIRRRFHEILHSWGLTVQQFNVLRILRGAGDDGLPTLEVAERMIEKTPGVTRLLDRLEDSGWVRRERCSRDRRRVYCRITPAGLDLLSELDQPVEQGDRDCAGGLDRGEHKTLQALMARVAPE